MIRFAPLLLLTACATTPPEPVVRTVEVRIPFDDPACAREALARMNAEQVVYPDTDEALRNAPNVFAGVQLLSAGRLLRIAREAAWRAAVEACAGR